MKLNDLKSHVENFIDQHVVAKRFDQPLLQSRFRASSIADCPRAILFTMMNLPYDKYPRAKSDTPKGYKLMDHGTAIHEMIQNYFIEMKLLDPNDLEKKKQIHDNEYCFSGRCDGILTLDDTRILLEIKTINERGFAIISQPKEAHFYQGQVYLHFLNKIYGENIQKILFLYVNRNDDALAMKEFWIDKDQKVIDIILNKLKVLKQYLEKREIYPIPQGFNPEDKSFSPCKWCPFNTPQLCKSGSKKMSDFPGAVIIPNKDVQKDKNSV